MGSVVPTIWSNLFKGYFSRQYTLTLLSDVLSGRYGLTFSRDIFSWWHGLTLLKDILPRRQIAAEDSQVIYDKKSLSSFYMFYMLSSFYMLKINFLIMIFIANRQLLNCLKFRKLKYWKQWKCFNLGQNYIQLIYYFSTIPPIYVNFFFLLSE